jgi:hypothetical protein
MVKKRSICSLKLDYILNNDFLIILKTIIYKKINKNKINFILF